MHSHPFTTLSHFFRATTAIIFIVIVSGFYGFGQTADQIFEHLTTEHGLSSDKVASVIQDREGFYWIATQNGLNRFDGTSFKIFRHHPDDTTSLTHNSCSSLAEDHNGDIWIATYTGISKFVKSKGQFQRIYLSHPDHPFEVANRVSHLSLDPDGNIWISGFGLWRFDVQSDQLILYQHDPSNPSSISDNSLIKETIVDTINNGLWFTTSENLNFYSFRNTQFYHSAHNPVQWKIFDAAYPGDIALDDKNQVWFRPKNTVELLSFNIGMNNITPTGKQLKYGLNKLCVDDRNRIWILYWLSNSEIYDPETDLTSTDFFSLRHDKSILSEKATDLFIDKEKNYWITSAAGVSIYNTTNQHYTLHQLNVNERGSENEPFKITGIAQTDSSHIWLATNVGLFKYDLFSQTYRKINLILPVNRITAICSDGDQLWIGYLNQILLFDTRAETVKRSYTIQEKIFFIEKGYQNEVWVGIWRNGLYRIDLLTHEIKHFTSDTSHKNALVTNSIITGFYEKGNLWLGYNLAKGFSKYNSSTNTFIHYNPISQFPTHAHAGTITSITKDPAGNHWLGTHGNGVYRWNEKNNTYKSYQQYDGLFSNFINSIVPDKQGNIWISCSDGINYFNTEKQSILNIDIDFVHPSHEHVDNGLIGQTGKIYFFRVNELAELFPDKYVLNLNFPKLVISSFKVFDKEYPVYSKPQAINLSYQENFFTIEFSSIKTDPLKKVNYAYMLQGFDKNWIDAGSHHMASYTNVPGGHYLFKLKASNDAGEMSDVLLSFPIRVTPPYWRTWWFIILCIVFITAAIYMLYLYRVKQLKKLFLLRTKISRDLHDDIGGSLSSINIYSTVAENEINNNPEKAKEFLQQINTSSREVMENISDIVWANKMDTTSSLATRIKNYGYELLSQKNIDCEYFIDSDVERKLTSPDARKNILMIVKEALNNMAKYSEASQAEVRVDIENSYLQINIWDNGIGFDMQKANERGNGLAHLKQRSALMRGEFILKSSPGKGTSIRCEIPLAKISDGVGNKF